MRQMIAKRLATGTVTHHYPAAPAPPPPGFLGKPEVDLARLLDPLAIARACPTGAIRAYADGESEVVEIGYDRCVFCGLCADAAGDGSVRMTREFELAATDMRDLLWRGRRPLSEERRAAYPAAAAERATQPLAIVTSPDDVTAMGNALRQRTRSLFGRSLHIRHVDTGSCNACEWEMAALLNPVHDVQRFGIDFVASPRHADCLLVTGPATRHLAEALRRTYEATPEPKLVVAMGACAISGGPFAASYATEPGGVAALVPIDVYIPGCPPRPQAIIQGLLLALGRAESRMPHPKSVVGD